MIQQLSMFDLIGTPVIPLEAQKKGMRGWIIDISGIFLRENGFKRCGVPNTCPNCYTISDFAKDHPIGTFVVKSENHVTAVVDGSIYDAWDSRRRIPMYFWEKTEEQTERKDD